MPLPKLFLGKKEQPGSAGHPEGEAEKDVRYQMSEIKLDAPQVFLTSDI
jgi:hypothetical protein